MLIQMRAVKAKTLYSTEGSSSAGVSEGLAHIVLISVHSLAGSQRTRSNY